MTEETTQAAQVDPLDAFVQEAIDQDSAQSEQENQQVDSAPAKEEPAIEPEPATEAEKPAEDGFQKRINKVTADKYAEKRRADELQKKLDELTKQQKPEPVKPTLEAHDYDEEAFNQANVAYQVQQEMNKQLEVQKQQVEQQQEQEAQAAFNQRIAELGKDDFAEKANAIPVLPDGVASALMQADNGPEMIYYLGDHLDKADALSNMTPAMALMEIGKMSEKINEKKQPKLSAAPDPIEPIKSGGGLSSEIDGDMSIEEWMAKYN